MSFANDIVAIKSIFEDKKLFKAASQANLDRRMDLLEPAKKAIRARRAKDTWEQRKLDFEPSDIDPWFSCWFEDMGEDVEDEMDPKYRNEYFGSFILDCLELCHVDLQDLQSKYLGLDEETRNESAFFEEAQERLAKAGYYVYNSDTRFEVYHSEDMAEYDIEGDLGESVNEAGMFKPASKDNIATRKEEQCKSYEVQKERLIGIVQPYIIELSKTHNIIYVGLSVVDVSPLSFRYDIHIDGKMIELYAWEEEIPSSVPGFNKMLWTFTVGASFYGSSIEFSANAISRMIERWLVRMSINDKRKNSPFLPESVNEAGLFKPADDVTLSNRAELMPNTVWAGGRAYGTGSNGGVIQRFVNGATRGRTSTGNMSIDGDILYSYQTPIAIRKDNLIYYGDLRHSRTTSAKHQGPLRMMAGNRLRILPGREFIELAKVTPGSHLGWLSEKTYEAGMFKPASLENIDARNEEVRNKYSGAFKELKPIVDAAVKELSKKYHVDNVHATVSKDSTASEVVFEFTVSSGGKEVTLFGWKENIGGKDMWVFTVGAPYYGSSIEFPARRIPLMLTHWFDRMNSSMRTVDMRMEEAGLFKPAGEVEINNRPQPEPWPAKFVPYIGKRISIKCRDYCRPEEPLVGVVTHNPWPGYHSQLDLIVDGYGGKAKHLLDETDELVTVLEEGVNEENMFKPAGDAALAARGYTGVQYCIWIGNYFYGTMGDKDAALFVAKALAKKHKDVMVYQVPVGIKDGWTGGKRIFPPQVEEAGRGLFKPASDVEISNRPQPPKSVKEYWYEVYRHNYTGSETVDNFTTYAEALKKKLELESINVGWKYDIDKWWGDDFSNDIVEDWTPAQEQVQEAGMFKPASDANIANRKNIPADKNDPTRLALDLERAGFTDGVDVSPEISLLEYGILRNSKTNKVVFALQDADQGYKFDVTTVTFEEVKEKLEEMSPGFFKTYGMSKENYFKYLENTLASVINDINGYDGSFTDYLNWDMTVADVRKYVLSDQVVEAGMFKPASDANIAARRSRSANTPPVGGFQYPFLRYIEDADPDLKTWHLVGMDSHINMEQSEIYFGVNGEPEFLISMDTEQIIRDELTKDNALTEECQKHFEEYDSGGWSTHIAAWVKFKGWKVLYSGNTCNNDPAYWWGEIFEYTEFEDADGNEGIILMMHRGGDYRGNYAYPVVYTGDVQEFMGMQRVDPESEISMLFGYGNYEDLVKDIEEYRNPPPVGVEAEPRHKVMPGQMNWALERGETPAETYYESKV